VTINSFVGRERELVELEQFLEQARAGSAQVVFVAGEAGAGKSALLHEFVSHAEAADPNVVAA
jgi:predicted ATPase